MRVYWCATCGQDGRNFGDRLGPVLLRHFGMRVEWAPPAEAELVSAGSVLSKFGDRWTGTVLGTGLIQASMRRSLPRARILAVRGALTRDACSLPLSTTLGDPGILVPDLLTAERQPAADAYTAIVPHYVDRTMEARHPRARRIDILADPSVVIAEIAGASLVYTSSLHALIAADALGVPHILELSTTTGGLHKFRDYASAFEEALEPEKIRLTDRGAMAERQREIRRLFLELSVEAREAEDRAGPPQIAEKAVTARRVAPGRIRCVSRHRGPVRGLEQRRGC